MPGQPALVGCRTPFDNGVTLRSQFRFADYDKFYQNVFPGAVDAATCVDLRLQQRDPRTNLFNQTDLSSRGDRALRHKMLAGVELGRQASENFRNTGYFTSVDANVTSYWSRSARRYQLPVSSARARPTPINRGVATVAALYAQDQMALSPHVQSSCLVCASITFNIASPTIGPAPTFDLTTTWSHQRMA